MNAIEGLAQVNVLAATTALSAWNVAGDFLIIIILLSAFFLFAWYMNYGQLVALLLALYAAYALYVTFPYQSFLPTAPALTALLAQIGLYIALVFIFYIILRRVVVSDFLYIGVMGVIILSFLGAAFLMALAYHVFPVAEVYTFTPPLDLLFAPAKYFWWWFIAPVVGLFFLAR